METLMERGVLATSREDEVRALMAKPYWTYDETALMLAVTPKTLRNMKWKREISFSKFGRRVYFSRDLIMKELRQNMVLCPATALGARRSKKSLGGVPSGA